MDPAEGISSVMTIGFTKDPYDNGVYGIVSWSKSLGFAKVPNSALSSIMIGLS